MQHVPGVSDRRAELLRRLGVERVADLLKHLPHRYEHHAGHLPVAELPLETVATARGQVQSCRFVPARSSPIGRPRGGRGRFTAKLVDATGTLDLVWFNGGYLRDRIHPGLTLTVTGTVKLYDGNRQIVNPKFQVVHEEGVTADEAPEEEGEQSSADLRSAVDGVRSGADEGGLVAVYPATEGLSTEQIRRLIAEVLPTALPQIHDHFDAEYRQRRDLPELRDAYRALHRPNDEAELIAARRRLAYDELLLLQLGFALKRQHTQTRLTAPPLRYSDAIDRHIRERFPFPLTGAQQRVIRELTDDLQRPTPMNRLLQGDVGSGKTVVALYALLLAVASNRQGVLMAPTELLAEQHFASITQMLADSSVRLTLLTGSLTATERAVMQSRIERGEVDIVVGTHAMLSEDVRFKSLALAVVDEQHRFGVVQRAAMRAKTDGEDTAPHTLVMTATPIPRTLSLSVFGDLDVSTIDELPPGRQPIATRVVPPAKSEQVYAYVARRVAKGEQAYVVLPTIEQTEAADLKAVRSHAEHLKKTHFAEHHLAAVHGRLKPTTRERIMRRFRDGKIDVLVATTVIEVGVDVPNASIMVVEHAERFGLAQLHQLRGRVGRGARKSLCVFIGETVTEDSAGRLQAIGSTTDGFAIAEADLRIRGMGELLGTKQSGLPPLRVADLTRHMDLLHLAKKDATRLATDDPTLAKDEHELLRKRLVKAYGEALNLADIG